MKGTTASSASILASSKKRRRGWLAQPVRQFDATVGAITARESVDDALTEGKALTAYLHRVWSDLVNPLPDPVPCCPHCDGQRVRPNRPKRGKLPQFFCLCHGCQREFNRFTGTPFARLQNRIKGANMIPLLSRQMSLLQAGERLGRTQKAMLSWLLAFRSYLLELDPTGLWEAKMRLGVRMAPRAQCTRCGFDGGFEAGGFDPQGRRRVRCPHCGRSRRLDALQDEGHARDGVVMHDTIDTAVRHRRKSRPEAIAPPVARTAAVGEATQDVRPRRYLADIPLPARALPPGPSDQQEDATLSAFLLTWVREALSQNMAAGRCPWCAS